METEEQGQVLHISVVYGFNEMISKAEKVNRKFAVRQISAQVTVQILLTPKDSFIL